MFKLTDKKNGSVHEVLQRAAREAVERRVRAAVASLQCPEHGRAASRIRVECDGGKEGTIAATPCCETMRAEVERTIRAAFGAKRGEGGAARDDADDE